MQSHLTILNPLCKAKIHELEMALGIDENVLGLEVAVCDALFLV